MSMPSYAGRRPAAQLAPGGQRGAPRPCQPAVPSDPVIILAPPRSFTSVLGAVLGQHPQLYGLPETHLFLRETLAERQRHIARRGFPRNDGLLRAVAELFFGGQTEATVAQARGWLRRRRRWSTGAVLEAMAERVQPRVLVDKSPSTTSQLERMRRAYGLFPGARFVHLVRHPRGHAESVLKLLNYRTKRAALPATHWLVRLGSYAPPEEAGAAAEPGPQWGWYAHNRNVVQFLGEVPPAQVYRVRGEDLLTDLDGALPRLARWLGLRDDDAAVEQMKHPERSPYACLGPKGARFGNDSLFIKDPVLRPQRARVLSLDGPPPGQTGGAGFAPEVRRLAEEFGYA